MVTLITGAVAVVVLYLLLQMVRSADPAMLAKLVRRGGGVLALAVAAFTGLRGELAVALPLGFFGAGLLGWGPLSNAGWPSWPWQRASGERVVSPLADDDADVLVPPHQGQRLSTLTQMQTVALLLRADADGRALLERDLDRRFPLWRQDAQRDATGGSRRRPANEMPDEEAYQILGLKAGASRSDIVNAHRALIKKLHPDQGGSTYLAARVNEAKDVLLRTHHR